MNKVKAQKNINRIIARGFELVQKASGNISCFYCTEPHCCRNKKDISITGEEMAVLRSLATDHHKEKAKAQISAKLLTGVFTCPFLNEEGRCDVYEYRPISCSSYAVISGSDQCKNPHEKSAIVNPYFILEKLPKRDIDRIVKSGGYDLLDIFKEGAT